MALRGRVALPGTDLLDGGGQLRQKPGKIVRSFCHRKKRVADVRAMSVSGHSLWIAPFRMRLKDIGSIEVWNSGNLLFIGQNAIVKKVYFAPQ